MDERRTVETLAVCLTAGLSIAAIAYITTHSGNTDVKRYETPSTPCEYHQGIAGYRYLQGTDINAVMCKDGTLAWVKQ